MTTIDDSALTVAAHHHRGGFNLDIELTVGAGEVVVVIGANGSGKTSLLRAIAGLAPVDEGHIGIAGRAVDDPAANIFVPPSERRVGMVFQEYQLFDHLSVLDNIAFGPLCRGGGRRAARTTARHWLDRLGITDLADSRPPQLSGGQRQRVAVGRALANDPAVLLLDEPFAALDVENRQHVRHEMSAVLAEFDGACVLVTHDPIDVYNFAHRVAVVDRGQLAQLGSLASLTAHPRSRFVAELVGTNLVSGRVEGNRLYATSGGSLTVVSGVSGPALASIRPSSVAISLHLIESSARNTIEGTVTDIDRLAERVRVTLTGSIPLVAEITVESLAALELQVGDKVYAAMKATDIEVYPA